MALLDFFKDAQDVCMRDVERLVMTREEKVLGALIGAWHVRIVYERVPTTAGPRQGWNTERVAGVMTIQEAGAPPVLHRGPHAVSRVLYQFIGFGANDERTPAYREQAREAWERLVGAGLIPELWVDDPGRVFFARCPDHSPGVKWRDGTRVSVECRRCVGNTGHVFLPHPPGVLEVWLFARRQWELVEEAERGVLTSARLNSHPPPECIAWHTGDVEMFQQRGTKEEPLEPWEQYLYEMGWGRRRGYGDSYWTAAGVVKGVPLVYPGALVMQRESVLNYLQRPRENLGE